MTDSILAEIRNGNLDELDNYYKATLANYTNLYEEYLNKVSGNEDDMTAAEHELQPQIVEKNALLINLAELFLKNNQRSLELIENDYKDIDTKTKQLQDLRSKYENLDTESFDVDKADEIKGQKRIENIEIYSKSNNIILVVLTVINLLLLTFLILGIAKLIMNKQNNL